MPGNREPYYGRYNDHYRELYAAGIEYWSAGPDTERNCTKRCVERVLAAKPDPAGLGLIEIGCGEGLLMSAVRDLGLDYTGIDYSPEAIRKARTRAEERGLTVDLRVMDALEPHADIALSHFDIVLDWSCFHMFVLDDDSRRYLATVRDLLRDDGVYILINQAWDEGAPGAQINSIQDYEKVFDERLSVPKTWDAWDGETWVPVELPRFAARPRSRSSYVKLFQQAGFRVANAYGTGSQRNMLDFILAKA